MQTVVAEYPEGIAGKVKLNVYLGIPETVVLLTETAGLPVAIVEFATRYLHWPNPVLLRRSARTRFGIEYLPANSNT